MIHKGKVLMQNTKAAHSGTSTVQYVQYTVAPAQAGGALAK